MTKTPSRLALPTAILCAAALSSCATILGESDYPITFNTTPSGGNIAITNKSGVNVYQGSTPITLTLPAGDGYFSGEKYAIEASMPGYPTTTTIMDTTIDGWYVGNILFGGIIGLLFVDPSTGAMYKLGEDLTIDLDPTEPEEEEAEPMSLN